MTFVIDFYNSLLHYRRNERGMKKNPQGQSITVTKMAG